MIPEAHKQLMESEEYIEEILFPLVIIASKMIYSRYFSKEAKKCTGKKGFLRSRCITRARVAGLAAQIKELRRHKDKCQTAKKKLKCGDRIEKEIAGISSKRYKLTMKLISYNYKERSKKQKEAERNK